MRFQDDFQVPRRQKSTGPFRPFDQAHSRPLKLSRKPASIHSRGHGTYKNQSDASVTSKPRKVQPKRRSGFSQRPRGRARAARRARAWSFPRQLAAQVDGESGLEPAASAAPSASVACSSGRIVFKRYHRKMETAVSESAIEARVKRWGHEVGFDAIAIAGKRSREEEARLIEWLDRAGTATWIIWHATERAARVPPSSCPARCR